ncbi:MAG: lamin tail domain-containing protein [Bacteroidota bacterium]
MSLLTLRFASLLLALTAMCCSAFAQGITVDGSDADWTSLNAVGQTNIAHIARDGAGNGQFIWTDRTADERNDFTSPARDTRVDIEEVRITGDASNLYVMVRMNDINQTNGDGTPMIQLALDTDKATNSGTADFGGFADTGVDAEAYWERLIITRFSQFGTDLLVWTTNFASQSNVGTAAISDANEIIEFSVPWSDLGITDPASTPMRFSLAAFRSDLSNNTWDSFGQSDALDALTNYGGDPGAILNTFDEVTDGAQNYYFDLYFDALGSVVPPVLISEVMYDPTGTEPGNEYVELYNLTSQSIDLTGFVLTDEEDIDPNNNNEGAVQLLAGNINSGALFLFANDAGEFNTTYGFPPEAAINDGGLPGIIGVLDFANWFNGTSNPFNFALANSGDQVILLDDRQTIIDVVTYGAQTWPSTSNNLTTPPGSSMERTLADVDTDDITNDFSIIAGGNPGNANTLPVEWADFFATLQSDGSVRLDWSTLQERFNQEFEVERSFDQLNFERLATVPAKGQAASYSYTDLNPQFGPNYYRIRQIDLDGSFSYTNVAFILLSDQRLAVYPNPFRQQLQIDVQLAQAGRLRVWLTDLQGRSVQSIHDAALPVGGHQIEFGAGSLPTGVYTLHISGAGVNHKQQILRVK